MTGDTTLGGKIDGYPSIDGVGAVFQGNGFNLTVKGQAEWNIYDTGESHLANITISDFSH